MKQIFPFIAILLLVSGIHAQESTCGTHFSDTEMHHLRTVLKKIPVSQHKDGEVDCVPIRYHIVRSDDGVSAATQAAVVSSLTMINRQFIDANLSFYLIEPPVFVDNSDYLALGDGVTEEDIRALFDTPQNAVQIYVMDDLDGPGGYAYYPSPTITSNAIFLLANAVMGSLGGTIPHELGHYFSLPHTFEGTEDGNTDANAENVARTGPNANCETSGDSFCDTNADPGNNGFVANCIYTGAEIDIAGDIYDPPLDNPMSYFPPQCKSFMTAEQYASVEQGHIFRQSQTAYNLSGPGLNVQPPTALTYDVDPGGGIILTFQDNADNEYGYFLEVSTEGSDALVALPSAYILDNQTVFTYSDYNPDLAYWFRVRPTTGDCNSYSNTVFIPGGLSLDADGSSGASPSNFTAEPLCGNGSAPLSDSDVLILGSTNGLEISIQLTGQLDGANEWIEATESIDLNTAGIGSQQITADNLNNLPSSVLTDWIRSVTYHHEGIRITEGVRTIRFTMSGIGSGGVSANASVFVDQKYDPGTGGLLTACPIGSPNWNQLLPENATEGTWSDESGQIQNGLFSFDALNGEYTYSTGTPGCAEEAIYTVIETEPPVWDLSVIQPKCETKCGGSIATEYSAPFFVSLDGMPFENETKNLCAGNFLFSISNGTGCNRIQSITLSNQTTPILTFPAELCTGDLIVLSDYSKIPSGTTASLNDRPISLYQPQFIVPSDSNTLSVYNYAGCIDRAFSFASINCPTPNNTHFFIPNAFTPDADGLNDLFKPICAFDLEFYELLIFDKQGNLIFESNDLSQGWNGSGQSGNLYFSQSTQLNYRIKYKFPHELEYRQTLGSVSLLR
jgi:gliding motility-associated-like protein